MATIKQEFKEKQKFTQWWVWVLLGVIYFSPFITNISSILENGFWGTFSPGILSHIFTLGAVIVLFVIMKLKTTVDQKGISIRYFPFLRKEFRWEDIEDIDVVNYNFSQVAGWAIRKTRYGKIYKVKGYTGLMLSLKNGKKYTIGTQNISAFQQAVNKYVQK